MTEYSLDDNQNLLNLQTSCRDNNEELEPEEVNRSTFVSADMLQSAWERLKQTTRFTCNMLLMPDDDDDQESSLSVPRTVALDPCGDDNLLTFWNMANRSYTLALSACHYKVEFSHPVFLPISVPSYQFSWTKTITTLVIDMDLSQAKSIFMDYYAAEHAAVQQELRARVNEEDHEMLETVEPAPDNHERPVVSSTVAQQPSNLPPLVTPNLRQCPRRHEQQQDSRRHDSILVGLEEMVENELNDMNRILTAMAGIGLLLLLSILWTLLQMRRRPKRSLSVNAVSLQPSRPVIDISPLSLDPILANAKEEEKEKQFSTPPQQPEDQELSPCSKLAQEWSRSKSIRRSHRKASEERHILSPNTAPQTFRFLPKPKMTPVNGEDQDENHVPGTPGLVSPHLSSTNYFVRSYWC